MSIGHEIALDAALGAAQQQRLHVGFEEVGQAAGAEDGLPGRRVEFALGGAGRARVERDQPVERRRCGRRRRRRPGSAAASQARVVEAVVRVGEVAVRDRTEAVRGRRRGCSNSSAHGVQAQARARFSVSTRWRWSRSATRHGAQLAALGRRRLAVRGTCAGRGGRRRPGAGAPSCRPLTGPVAAVGGRREIWSSAGSAPASAALALHRGHLRREAGQRRPPRPVGPPRRCSGSRSRRARAERRRRVPLSVVEAPRPRRGVAGGRCPGRGRCGCRGVLGVQVVQDEQAGDQFVAEQRRPAGRRLVRARCASRCRMRASPAP